MGPESRWRRRKGRPPPTCTGALDVPSLTHAQWRGLQPIVTSPLDVPSLMRARWRGLQPTVTSPLDVPSLTRARWRGLQPIVTKHNESDLKDFCKEIIDC